MSETLNKIYDTIVSRKNGDPKKSYVAKLFSKGSKKIAEKVAEEATETIIAALVEDKKETISESADLLFHLAVLWADKGVTPNDIMQELQNRMGISGLDEKAARKVKDI